MLPKSVHSLAEIAGLDLPIDRARELGLLFEHVLKQITPNWRAYKFHELISLHRPELPNFVKLEAAREARNAIVHGDRITERTILQAEAEFQFAIESILPVCPEAVQLDVRGTAAPPPPPAPKQPRDIPEPVFQAPPPPTPPSSQFQVPPQNSYLALAPPEPPRKLPQSIWFVLAAAFVLVAIFLYFAQPPSEQAKTFTPKDPPGGDGTISPPPTGGSGRRAARADIPSAPPARSKEAIFGSLINSNLSVSSSQPSLALLVDSSGPSTLGSINDSLGGFLSGTKFRIVANLADLNALKTQGFFDDLFGGNSTFLSQAAQLSHVDYILLGKATYSFRRQPELDPDLMTCDLSLTSRLADRTGTVVRTESFSTTGPGFTPAQALERATENAARQLKERILNAIR
jgi:hypothetical protein